MKPKHVHKLVCEAPICHDDYEPEYVWYPGESVCKKTPYRHFQRIQLRLNKVALKNETLKETMFTTKELQERVNVKKAVKGKNPNNLYRYAIK